MKKYYDDWKWKSKEINVDNEKQVKIGYTFPNLDIKLSTTGAIDGDRGHGGKFTIESEKPEIDGNIIINDRKGKNITLKLSDIDKIQMNFYGGLEVDILQDIAKEINKLITIKNKELKEKK